MTFDLMLRNARIVDREGSPADIGISNGRFAVIEVGLPKGDAPEEDFNGRDGLPRSWRFEFPAI